MQFPSPAHFPSNGSKSEKQPLCWHWLTQARYSPSFSLFLSFKGNTLQCFSNKNGNVWISSQPNQMTSMAKGLQGSHNKKTYKLHPDSLHFRLFHRLIMGTISAPWFILTAKEEKKILGFCWCLCCSKCSGCQMADSHLATRRNSNPALPRQRPPWDRRKERGKCLLISRISGDRKKNMFNEAPRRFSEQREKTPFRLRSPPAPAPRRGG